MPFAASDICRFAFAARVLLDFSKILLLNAIKPRNSREVFSGKVDFARGNFWSSRVADGSVENGLLHRQCFADKQHLPRFQRLRSRLLGPDLQFLHNFLHIIYMIWKNCRDFIIRVYPITGCV